jgi:hypothetical protein
MLKRNITYEDFNGNSQTNVFYFNLSKAELVEFEASVDGGLESTIRDIVAAENKRELIALFKRLILMSIGERSEDGQRFVKTDRVRDEFQQTNAYSELFMELATDDTAATEFIKGILPRDISDQVDAELSAQTPNLPPPPGGTA